MFHIGWYNPDRGLLELILQALHTLINQGERFMATLQEKLDEMTAKVDALTAADEAREARDVAQDAVTAQQITALQASIDALNAIIAAGGLTAAQEAQINASITKTGAVIDSLNNADPTPPVV